MILNADEFFVGDDPLRRDSSSAFLFCGTNAFQSAPFTHGEFGLAQDLCDLGGRVPFLHGSLLNEYLKHGLDSVQMFGHVILRFGLHFQPLSARAYDCSGSLAKTLKAPKLVELDARLPNHLIATA